MDPDAAAASSNAAGASGSGSTAEQRSADVNAQNAKAVVDGIKASLKRASEDSGDDVERATRGSTAAATTSPQSPRGRKRDAENDADDTERVNRDTAVEKLQKRKDAEQDDTARTENRADDMSSFTQHPGPVHSGGRIDRADLLWKHIGSGVFARTFPRSRRLVTTTT